MTENVVLRKEKESLILEALELKEKLKGSVIMEFVRCGKKCARCNSGPGHPASYLHYYDSTCPYKVRRKYLRKDLAGLMSYSKEELETMLQEAEQVLGQEVKETEEILGQDKVETLTYKEAAKTHKKLRW
jgi:hypothetical protein